MKQRLYAGRFLRSLRETHGLRQSALAARLGISAPYLSQLENDSRPLPLALAGTLREQFPVDWADMAEAPLEPLVTALMEAAGDPLLRDHLPTDQIARIAEQFPQFAEQFARLYQLHRRDGQRLAAMDEALGADRMSGGRLPWEEVRDWFHLADNYCDAIDTAAETLAQQLGAAPAPSTAALESWFAGQDIAVHRATGGAMRDYDPATSTLRLGAEEPRESQRFQLAYQLCALALAGPIAATVAHAQPTTPTARHLLQVGLTNYAAGALVMPYRAFREAARRLRHDIEALRTLFGTSFEQTCHRLSTLQRPHARGVPLSFCKIDMAGNITKRHAADGLQFARFGAACPLWIAHEAAAFPERMHCQLAEMPEGRRFVFFARGVARASAGHFSPARRYALVLGCEITLASEFAYADALNLACEAAVARIGISCRICSRHDCPQRAYPPNEKPIAIGTNRRGAIPYHIVD
jgi:predicted transcriptional regulator/transcriptional regulator with XRE-family HTH domain